MPWQNLTDKQFMKNRAFNDGISLGEIVVGVGQVVWYALVILFAVAVIVLAVAWELIRILDKASKPRRRRSYW